jgi:predicted phage terminase large subunit-like protein
LIKPEGDKQARLYTQTVVMENGQVFIPRSAPWLEDFKHEILSFPFGKHDDQVDSLSQFLTWLDQQKRRGQVRVRDF